MGILEVFKENAIICIDDCDYTVLTVNEETYVGYDQKHLLSVIFKSDKPNIDSFSQRANLISIETNKLLKYELNGNVYQGIFNVLKCYSPERKDQEVFLKLCDTYFYNDEINTEKMGDIFMTLTTFFSKRKSYSREELQGLYGELYTLYYFYNTIDLTSCWQKKDNLKFDFSIDSKTKLEIKTTLKDDRIHKFNHEQLAAKIYDIYILSYKLKYDDSGLRLSKLITNCIELLKNHSEKVRRLYKVLYECSDDELDKHIYSEEYIQDKMRLYNAKDVPHYDDIDGVTHVSYNSNFENVETVDIEAFIEFCKEKLKITSTAK